MPDEPTSAEQLASDLACVKQQLRQAEAENSRLRSHLDRLEAEKAKQGASDAHREIQLFSVIEYTPDLIFIKDLEGRFMLVNPAYAALQGLAPADYVGKRVSEIFPETSWPFFEAVDRLVIETRQAHTYENVMMDVFGHRHVFSTNKYPLISTKGEVFGLVGISRDITMLKEIESQLRDREAQLAEAQRIAHIGSWEFDLNTWKVTWSDEHYQIFGLLPEHGQPSVDEVFALIHPQDLEVVQAQLRVPAPQPQVTEFRIIRPDGQLRYISSNFKPVSDDAETEGSWGPPRTSPSSSSWSRSYSVRTNSCGNSIASRRRSSTPSPTSCVLP